MRRLPRTRRSPQFRHRFGQACGSERQAAEAHSGRQAVAGSNSARSDVTGSIASGKIRLRSKSVFGQTSKSDARIIIGRTLRRGKPTEAAPQEEDEPAAKTGKPESAATAAAASPGPVQLVPAISDAGGPDPQSYKFFWKTGEEEERRNQMFALAAR